MSGKKIAVGLSGGVDSSVATYLLKKQGYEVTGVFIEAYNEPGCRTDQDNKDALQVALKLGIPFKVIDVRTEYKRRVVDYFVETYQRGATPNPDVVCNREVKFGIFYEWAYKNGFDYVATGHYARMKRIMGRGDKLIMRAKDLTKDQSYFLWQVRSEYLERVIWPLGEMKKSEVRQIARAQGFANADKPDSMGVCMMGELNLRQFLMDKLGEKPGEVIFRGEVVGQHSGLWFHTVGQRGGIEIDKKKLKKMGYKPEDMRPLYVIGKNIEKNELLVGEREEATRDEFRIMNFELRVTSEEINNLVREGKVYVRIRNLGELNQVSRLEKENIILGEAIFGVAEGQAAVLYWRNGAVGDEVVLGGGEIAT